MEIDKIAKQIFIPNNVRALLLHYSVNTEVIDFIEKQSFVVELNPGEILSVDFNSAGMIFVEQGQISCQFEYNDLYKSTSMAWWQGMVYFSDTIAYTNTSQQNVHLQCDEKSKLILIKGKHLLKVAMENINFLLFWHRKKEAISHAQKEWLVLRSTMKSRDYVLFSLAFCFLYFHTCEKQLELHYGLDELSHYFNCSRQYLVKIFDELEDSGCIKRSYCKIEVVNLPILIKKTEASLLLKMAENYLW